MEQENKEYDLLFVTTFLDIENIYLFLESLMFNGDINLCVVLIAQNGFLIDISRFSSNKISINVISREEKLSISNARNIGLRYAMEQQIDYRYVMFPDDDSTFDVSFFEKFKSQIKGNTLIGVRTRQDINQYYLTIPKDRTLVDSKTDCRYAISVNIVVSRTTVEAVGGFDEELGVGCYYGSGEDCDFYLRSSKVFSFVFNDQLYSIHPAQSRMDFFLPYDKLVSRYKSYGRGMVYMYCKNRLFVQAAIVVLRGFLGSVSCMLRGRFKMSFVYLSAFFVRLSTFISLIFCKF